jgi:hypothetical protein
MKRLIAAVVLGVLMVLIVWAVLSFFNAIPSGGLAD